MTCCSLCGKPPVLLAELTDCPRCQIRALSLSETRQRAADAAADRRDAAAKALEEARRLVVLVGCGEAKREGRHPARALYTSNLFRGAVRWAEGRAPGHVFVVSAKHLLVSLDQELESYEHRLARCERAWWATRVVAQLAERYGAQPLRVVVLAGADYADALAAALPAEWRAERPLAGMDLFERMRWLRQEAA